MTTSRFEFTIYGGRPGTGIFCWCKERNAPAASILGAFVRYGSVCSGIEAATAAWHGLGWEPAFFSEIEAFPRAVLEHHYPNVPLHGDFTTIGDDYGPIQLLVGGTPCQSFSVAGLRKGLDDDRGNLALEYLKLAQRKRPRWLVWENVPGVLSSNGGRDFGAFLGGLVELGYGFAYRVLDAQYFGVPQRRRRVFVVGYLGDWRPPAAVLFEPESMSGNPAPGRETRQAIAEGAISRALTSSETATGRLDPNEVTFIPERVVSSIDASLGRLQGCSVQDANHGHSHLLPLAFGWQNSASQGDSVSEDVTPTLDKSKVPAVASALTSTGVGTCGPDDNQAQANHLIAFEWQSGQGISKNEEISPTLVKQQTPAVAFMENQRGELRTDEVTDSLKGQGGKPGQGYQAAIQGMAVRRLTPRECERLQGFPDDYTAIPYRNKPAEQCPDGPRYKALGNSMAVPVMKWIGERIQDVDEILAMEKGVEIIAEMNT